MNQLDPETEGVLDEMDEGRQDCPSNYGDPVTDHSGDWDDGPATEQGNIPT